MGAGREESGEKTELSGLRLRVRIVPEVRGMMKFARRRQPVPVQEHRSLRIYVQISCTDRVVRRAPSAAHVQHVPLNRERMVHFRREHGIQRLTSAKLILLARM